MIHYLKVHDFSFIWYLTIKCGFLFDGHLNKVAYVACLRWLFLMVYFWTWIIVSLIGWYVTYCQVITSIGKPWSSMMLMPWFSFLGDMELFWFQALWFSLSSDRCEQSVFSFVYAWWTMVGKYASTLHHYLSCLFFPYSLCSFFFLCWTTLTYFYFLLHSYLLSLSLFSVSLIFLPYCWLWLWVGLQNCMGQPELEFGRAWMEAMRVWVGKVEFYSKLVAAAVDWWGRLSQPELLTICGYSNVSEFEL